MKKQGYSDYDPNLRKSWPLQWAKQILLNKTTIEKFVNNYCYNNL